ncbi:Glutamate or tyrosine decarboxylase [Chitinophaga rupis]|uniref:Glutamate or tyrosine decarboxylase n=1 Tax=Chitinophaga rupis TaxID=573321 RepID=A0A1H7XED1_9BACT|nr:pyridoxal-dependent decarboxylase [Chitinophaga rupis]SEM31538.1 Glutamate or tyrosine decarboxylase [Chitinophaga rupis]
MNAQLEQDLAQLNDLLVATQTFSTHFLSNIDELPASKYMPPPGNATLLPEQGIGAMAALQQFRQQYGPYLAAGAGARYWGFVTGGVTPAALAGDWVASAIDMNAADKGGAAFNIEIATIQMLRQLFGLPDDFEGSFVSGATMSNFAGLAVARQWLGEQQGVDVGQQGIGVLQEPKVLACTPHSSVAKSLSMLGFGRDALIKIPALPQREAVDVDALEAWLQQHKGRPVIFVASAGTVNTTDFDDLAALARLKQQYNFWLHVDAAFGGFAACSPQHRHLVKGWEAADSITIDAHKWMNVPYDAAMIFCRHPSLQAAVFKNVGAAYLGDPAKDFNFIHHVPENSRRLRALPAWYSLQAYGAKGYQDIVEANIQQANLLGSLISDSPYFRLLAPVKLSVVCFTLSKPLNELDEATTRFLEILAERGVAFMTPTVYLHTPAIRAALVSWRTTEQDVRRVWKEMEEIAQSLKPKAESKEKPLLDKLLSFLL